MFIVRIHATSGYGRRFPVKSIDYAVQRINHYAKNWDMFNGAQLFESTPDGEEEITLWPTGTGEFTVWYEGESCGDCCKRGGGVVPDCDFAVEDPITCKLTGEILWDNSADENPEITRDELRQFINSRFPDDVTRRVAIRSMAMRAYDLDGVESAIKIAWIMCGRESETLDNFTCAILYARRVNLDYCATIDRLANAGFSADEQAAILNALTTSPLFGKTYSVC